MAWFTVEQPVLLGVIALCHRPDSTHPAKSRPTYFPVWRRSGGQRAE
jgi:hypothetical protein